LLNSKLSLNLLFNLYPNQDDSISFLLFILYFYELLIKVDSIHPLLFYLSLFLNSLTFSIYLYDCKILHNEFHSNHNFLSYLLLSHFHFYIILLSLNPLFLTYSKNHLYFSCLSFLPNLFHSHFFSHSRIIIHYFFHLFKILNLTVYSLFINISMISIFLNSFKNRHYSLFFLHILHSSLLVNIGHKSILLLILSFIPLPLFLIFIF